MKMLRLGNRYINLGAIERAVFEEGRVDVPDVPEDENARQFARMGGATFEPRTVLATLTVTFLNGQTLTVTGDAAQDLKAQLDASL